MQAFPRFCLRRASSSASTRCCSGASYAGTTYYGSEMEDVEVYDGIGYFSSDVNGSTGRTGVDIVDLSIPFDPIMLSRVDTSDCLSGNPGVCAHGKVHTLSIQRFNANTPSEQRFMYTSDNDTDVVKITECHEPFELRTCDEALSHRRWRLRSTRTKSSFAIIGCTLPVRSESTATTDGDGFTFTMFRTRPIQCCLRGF